MLDFLKGNYSKLNEVLKNKQSKAYEEHDESKNKVDFQN